MSQRITTRDRDAETEIAAAFSTPSEEGTLIPYSGPGVAISATDGVITAQKVAVERDLPKVMRNIKVMAAAAGEDWYYRFPVRSKGGTDWIEGPSIKCANNVARMYGNCQIDTRVVDNGDSWIIYARFVDYETGFSMTRPFQQRKGQATMNTRDQGRSLDIALQIGVSKAIRNVVCNALETFTTFAFDEAKNNMVEKVGKRLPDYRDKVMKRFVELKVDIARVEAVIGRSAKDWLAPDVARIIAELQSVQDGMATADETWPHLGTQARMAGNALDRFEDAMDAAKSSEANDGTVDAEIAEAAPADAPAQPAPEPQGDARFLVEPPPAEKGRARDWKGWQDRLLEKLRAYPGDAAEIDRVNRPAMTALFKDDPVRFETVKAALLEGLTAAGADA